MNTILLTLPSNASSDIFPDNTICNFRTQLSDRIYLTREHYEIALMQISYINSLKTFSKDEDNIIQCLLSKSNIKKEVIIPNRSYSNILHFVTDVNRLMKDVLGANVNIVPKKDGSKKVTIDYLTHDAKYNRVKLNTSDSDIIFSAALSSILGFHKTKFKAGNEYTAELVPDLKAGMHSMFVYCDLVESQYVGDKKAPLLRELPLLGSEGESVVQTFALPFYIPLRTSQFDTLHIQIADESGDPIPFEKGHLTVTLHIRPS